MTQENTQKVITRFAPSPTGFMHIGGIRTAIFAWAWARKNNGTFILRIEDTDKVREVDGSMEHIMECLTWLGITWDFGPDKPGDFGSCIQSERLESYKKYALILVEKGLAYADPYTEAELETFREQAKTENRAFLYRDHRPENPPVWDGTQPLRLKVEKIEEKKWFDVVRGDLSAGAEALDDFILIKSDGYPTYNFAHIIDDLEMKVTHVMRGQEFISSTPKYIALYEALQITPPVFVTLPPIMADDGKKKLGKRDGAKDLLEYRKEGYLSTAMLNFLALIGWNPGTDQEVFTPGEFVSLFELSKIHKAGGQANEEKLDWFNKEHIKKLSLYDQHEAIKNELTSFLALYHGYDEERLKRLVPIIIEHISKWSDIQNLITDGELDYYFAPTLEIKDKAKINWKETPPESTKKYLEEVQVVLTTVSESDWTYEALKNAIWPLTETHGRGDVLWPLRYSLSGKDRSPDPFMLLYILGKETSILRLDTIIDTLV